LQAVDEIAKPASQWCLQRDNLDELAVTIWMASRASRRGGSLPG